MVCQAGQDQFRWYGTGSWRPHEEAKELDKSLYVYGKWYFTIVPCSLGTYRQPTVGDFCSCFVVTPSDTNKFEHIFPKAPQNECCRSILGAFSLAIMALQMGCKGWMCGRATDCVLWWQPAAAVVVGISSGKGVNLTNDNWFLLRKPQYHKSNTNICRSSVAYNGLLAAASEGGLTAYSSSSLPLVRFYCIKCGWTIITICGWVI